MGILKKTIISAIGDVGAKSEQLKRWIEVNGGRWMPPETKNLTHLICSKKAWKEEFKAVTLAMRYDTAIVSYDWLEDSLQSKRKLSTRKYLWTKICKERKRTKKMKRISKQADTKWFNEGCDKGLADTGSGMCKPGVSRSGHRESFVSSLAELKARREKRAQEGEKKGVRGADGGDLDDEGLSMENVEPVEHLSQNETLQSSSSSIPIGTTTTPQNKSSPDIVNQPVHSNHSSLPFPEATPTSTLSSTTATNPNSLKDNYHLHIDSTGFVYDITLTRRNFFRNLHAIYTLRLYASNTLPTVYTVILRYRPPSKPAWTTENALTNTPGIPGIHYPPTTPHAPTKEPASTIATNPLDPRILTALQKLHPPPLPDSTSTALWKTLLCPLHTPFPLAFAQFRHAFQTLTFLTWEERLLPHALKLQHTRARSFNLEPFFYKVPAEGLPFGLMPGPDAKLGDGGGGDGQLGLGERERYVRTTEEGWLKVPGMDVLLNREGEVGRLVVQECEERERREVERREREERRRKEQARLRMGIKREGGRGGGGGSGGGPGRGRGQGKTVVGLENGSGESKKWARERGFWESRVR